MSRIGQARSTEPARVRGGKAAPAEPVRQPTKTAGSALPGSDEQRRGSRRQPRPDRALVASFSDAATRNWVPRRWPYLILTMIAAIGSCAVATRSLPGSVTAAMLALAVIGAGCVGLAHRWGAKGRVGVRLAAVFAVVVAPMFLFGLALTRWTALLDLPWDVAIASL